MCPSGHVARQTDEVLMLPNGMSCTGLAPAMGRRATAMRLRGSPGRTGPGGAKLEADWGRNDPRKTVRMAMWRMMAVLAIFGALASAPAMAHAPLLACFDNGDATITCEAGYSDGAAAAGQRITVLDDGDRLLLEAQFDEDSAYTFDAPDADLYQVRFQGDAEHGVSVYSNEIY